MHLYDFVCINLLFFILSKQKMQTELEGIKKDLDGLVKQSEAALASSQQSTSAPVLRSELDITLKKMQHVHSLSSVYLDKLVIIYLFFNCTLCASHAKLFHLFQAKDHWLGYTQHTRGWRCSQEVWEPASWCPQSAWEWERAGVQPNTAKGAILLCDCR